MKMNIKIEVKKGKSNNRKNEDINSKMHENRNRKKFKKMN